MAANVKYLNLEMESFTGVCCGARSAAGDGRSQTERTLMPDDHYL